jgi:hypothetical protein
MTGGDKGKLSAGDRKGDPTRAERLRTALRDNLKRRKSQAKARSKGRTEGSDRPPADLAASHDSAGIVPDKSRT